MRVTMHGHGIVGNLPKRKPSPPLNRTLVSRMWRLGDIVMCEPINRALSRRGDDVSFSTKTEYHPIVRAFHSSPPSAIGYPYDDAVGFQRIINLDDVGLVHEGHTSKVDALLSASGIDPSSLSEDEKRPTLDLPDRYSSWARDLMSKRGVPDGSAVCVSRQSWNERSPRNIPRDTIDEVCRVLAIDHVVIVLGAMPTKMGKLPESIHNLTGSTPDVMSAAGIMSRCRAIITVDTGLMHVAGAMGVPMVTVMGPTKPEDVSSFYHNNSIIFAGRDGCSPCFERGCGNPCLRDVPSEMIVEVMNDRISNPLAATKTIII